MTHAAILSPESLRSSYLALPRRRRLWIAFSGGLDSTVLLHLARAAELEPRAVHVNHQLQAAAAGWAQHCRDVCISWGVPLLVAEVRPDTGAGVGLEAAARAARYGALRDCLQSDDVLGVAHHLDDQAETVLLRLVRGTGVTGLAAMHPVTVFTPGLLWRPLLNIPREELRDYARRHRLRWIQDPHNEDPRFSRSWLRAEIMPRLRQRWPAVYESLGRAARLAADADEVLRETAAADLASLKGRDALPIRPLLQLSAARRRGVLRLWLQDQGREPPPADVLERLDEEVLGAAEDAQPVLAHADLEFRRFRRQLYAMSRLPPAPEPVLLDWRGVEELALPPGCGRLEANAPPPVPLQVGFPTGGERLKPQNSPHTRTLKNLFQAARVAPWVRERTPLLYREGELVAVADRWRNAAFSRLCGKHAFRWRWRHELRGDGAS